MKPSRKSIAYILLMCTYIAGPAQTVKEEFNEYRNQMMGEYETFRQSVLSDYDSFLESIWADFEVFGAKSKYSEPKPDVAPRADATKPGPSVEIPTPDKPTTPAAPTPELTSKPSTPKTPTMPKVPTVPKVPKTPSVPKVPNVPGASTTPRQADNTPSQAAPRKDYSFPYRGMELTVADVPVKIKSTALQRSDFADQWRNIRNSGGQALVETFADLAKRHNLNDYLTYDVLMAYTAARFPDAHPSSRMSLVHYVMANLGCDVRIALDDGNQPLILIPFDQMVYARRFITINGYHYYVFGEKGGDDEPRINGLISTCTLPTDRYAGRYVNLLVNDLRLPEDNKDFDISFGNLHLTGKYNANIMPVLYRYPQMPTQDYATSNVQPELRSQIVEQVKSQLADMSKIEAVNSLLRFTQSGFKYATDGEFHGFEKPYFFEEMFHYPKCDCEDRSIFYTYLLWNALGVENHLIAYPVHESASVCIEGTDIQGDHYVHDGKTFFISDPTYIGARTGMCMPSFKKVAPTIDKEYK